MPVYDYFCPNCEKVQKNEFVHNKKDKIKCTRCGDNMCRLFPTTMAKVKPFPADGVYLEHVSPTGKRFKSKNEMRKYANDNNLELGYLL